MALGVQVVLGGLTVTEKLDAGILSAHLGTAMLIVLLIMTAWLATFVPQADGPPAQRQRVAERAGPPTHPQRGMARLAVVTALGTFALIVLGGYVSGTDSGFYCDGDWPALQRRRPARGPQRDHPRLASLPGRRRRAARPGLRRAGRRPARGRRPPSSGWRWPSGALFAVQIILGAAVMWTTLAEWSRVLHLVTGSVTWGTLVAMTALACYDAVRHDSLHRPRPLPALLSRRAQVGETRR